MKIGCSVKTLIHCLFQTIFFLLVSVGWTPIKFLLVALLVAVVSCTVNLFLQWSAGFLLIQNVFCAISITLNNSRDNAPFIILLICVYLPTDVSTAASHSAFSESLCELDGIISAEHFDNIIIVGDFNVDVSRPGPNCSNLSAI